MRFKHAAAVWRNKESGETYAFPMVLESDWGVEDAYPLINESTWEFICVLPAGQPVGDARHENGHRVSVPLGHVRLHTADWNLVADPAKKSPASTPKRPGVVVARSKRR